MGFFKRIEDEKAAKAWLHDAALAAGVTTENRRNTPLHFTPEFAENAKAVFDELLNRRCSNVDRNILRLSEYPFDTSLVEGEGIWAKPKPVEIAAYLVYFAKGCDTYWDFTDKMNLMEFGGTLLGHEVFARRQYVWLRDCKGNIPRPEADKVYCIVGRNPVLQISPVAQINPFSYRYAQGDTNRVIFKSKSHSENHCTCFFLSRVHAETFLHKLADSDRVGKHDCNLRVQERYAAEERGYGVFGTEFGDCLLGAAELQDLWRYHVDCYGNGNPFDAMSDDRLESFAENLMKE